MEHSTDFILFGEEDHICLLKLVQHQTGLTEYGRRKNQYLPDQVRTTVKLVRFARVYFHVKSGSYHCYRFLR
jgi:hypothetical protein